MRGNPNGLETPISLVEDIHGSTIVIPAQSSCFQIHSALHGHVYSGEGSIVKVTGLSRTSIDTATGVDEIFKTQDPVTVLSRNMPLVGVCFVKSGLTDAKPCVSVTTVQPCCA